MVVIMVTCDQPVTSTAKVKSTLCRLLVCKCRGTNPFVIMKTTLPPHVSALPILVWSILYPLLMLFIVLNSGNLMPKSLTCKGPRFVG